MNINTKILVILITTLGVITACSDTSTVPVPDPDHQNEPREASLFEKVVGHWDIDTAYHAGSYDRSSSGKDILIRNDGTYRFDNSLEGLWYFTPDSTKLILDEKTTYRQDWTLSQLTEARMVVDFKSPFTKQNSQWIMSKR